MLRLVTQHLASKSGTGLEVQISRGVFVVALMCSSPISFYGYKVERKPCENRWCLCVRCARKSMRVWSRSPGAASLHMPTTGLWAVTCNLAPDHVSGKVWKAGPMRERSLGMVTWNLGWSWVMVGPFALSCWLIHSTLTWMGLRHVFLIGKRAEQHPEECPGATRWLSFRVLEPGWTMGDHFTAKTYDHSDYKHIISP